MKKRGREGKESTSCLPAPMNCRTVGKQTRQALPVGSPDRRAVQSIRVRYNLDRRDNRVDPSILQRERRGLDVGAGTKDWVGSTATGACTYTYIFWCIPKSLSQRPIRVIRRCDASRAAMKMRGYNEPMPTCLSEQDALECRTLLVHALRVTHAGARVKTPDSALRSTIPPFPRAARCRMQSTISCHCPGPHTISDRCQVCVEFGMGADWSSTRNQRIEVMDPVLGVD